MKRLFAIFIVSISMLAAQTSVDRVVATIGESIILLSDIENQYNYYVSSGQKDDGTLKCQIFENLIISKLLYNKALQDSLTLGEGQLDQEVERRVNYMMQAYGGKEGLEKTYGKTVPAIKNEIRDDIEEQLLTDQMRQKVIAGIDITPAEVKDYFAKIDKDSLPYVDAQVELFHIVKTRPFSQTSIEEKINKLNEIKDVIESGTFKFGEAATVYSEGPSAADGGSLGTFTTGVMDPIFEDVAFDQTVNEISDPFVSSFGVHILEVTDRFGKQVSARHIILIPEKSLTEDSIAIKKLLSIKRAILADSISFQKAAIAFTDDKPTKDCGGCIKNPQTGEAKVTLGMLDPDTYFKIENMKEGNISDPVEITQPNGEKAFRIIYLKRRIPPHKANLVDDYQGIASAAKQEKQFIKLENWIDKAKENIHIDIKNTECIEILENWVQ